jgi:beta-carotene/zeaxanthin 4-ketolase
MASQQPIQWRSWQAESRWGLTLTIVLVGAWLSTLGLLLPLALESVGVGWIVGAIVGRTFLHTGLFILAHDAMHLNLIPQHKPLNQWIGRICVGLYGFLSYAKCRENHGQHHRIPAQVGDPDFHDGVHDQPLWWYWHFLGGYLSRSGFGWFTLGWIVVFGVACGCGTIAVPNMLVFWVLPLILSSLQLFIFGTYLPHRIVGSELPTRSAKASPAATVSARLWSLFNCYHFGNYHAAHHRYPKMPWYRLPSVHSTIAQP